LADAYDLQPIPGVTHLSLESLDVEPQEIRRLLTYFPDLCHLTLGLETFLFLLAMGTTSLLDRNTGGPCNILVVGQTPVLNVMWNSDVGKQLKALNIKLKENGFELLSD
jgi:hypothetical protein